MTLYTLKPQFQSMLRPTARALYRSGVIANDITLAAAAGSVLLGLMLMTMPEETRRFLLVPVWLLVRMAFNALDGMLAREFGQATPLGGYLNELADVTSDTMLYLPFAFLPGANPWLVAAVIWLAIVSELAGILGSVAGGQRRYDGPMGKSDRALVFGLAGLLVGLGFAIEALLNWCWAVMAAFLCITIVVRVRRGLVDRPLP